MSGPGRNLSLRSTGHFIMALVMLCYSTMLLAKNDIQLQGLFSDKAVISIDGSRHLMQAGQTSAEGVKLVSIGKDSAILEVDGKRNEYRMGGAVSTSFEQVEVSKQTVYADDRGMYHTIGTINGQPVNNFEDLASVLFNSTKAGQTITLTILRNGQTKSVSLTLGAMPKQLGG